MMLQRLREREEGFTLIELLVVIIIIGILAAIAIPTFLNQRTRGYNAASQSALRNAAIAQESYYTGNNTYGTEAQIETEGFNQSANVNFAVVSASATDYCMSAVHTSGGSTWYLDSTSGGGAPTTTQCT